MNKIPNQDYKSFPHFLKIKAEQNGDKTAFVYLDNEYS